MDDRHTCQWCQRYDNLRPVVRGRDGPFWICTTCRELGLRMGYEDVPSEKVADG